MRRFKIIIISIIMLFCTCTPCFASPGEDLIREINGSYSKEIEDVTLTVRDCYHDWEQYIGTKYDDILFSLMYQLYYLTNKNIFDAYEKNGNFGDNISDKYIWRVPNYSKGGELEVARNDGSERGWSVRRGSNFLKNFEFYYPDIKPGVVFRFDNILSNYPHADTDTFKYVKSDLIDCYLMYFVSENVEYLVPYFDSPDVKWMENAKIYTADSFISIAKKNVAGINQDDTEANGPVNSKAFQRIYILYIAVGTIIVVALMIFVIFIAKKKSNSELKDETDINS